MKKSGNVSIMLILTLILLQTLTTAAVILAVSTTRDTTTLTLGEGALTIAESGAENALLRLLRDPAYPGELDLPIGEGSATIVVNTTGSTKTIVSTGRLGQMVRTIQMQANLIGGQLTVLAWQEL